MRRSICLILHANQLYVYKQVTSAATPFAVVSSTLRCRTSCINTECIDTNRTTIVQCLAPRVLVFVYLNSLQAVSKLCIFNEKVVSPALDAELVDERDLLHFLRLVVRAPSHLRQVRRSLRLRRLLALLDALLAPLEQLLLLLAYGCYLQFIIRKRVNYVMEQYS